MYQNCAVTLHSSKPFGRTNRRPLPKTKIQAASSEEVSDTNHPPDAEHKREEPLESRLLEILIQKVAKKLEEDSCELKVQDALKAIQLKQKFSKGSQAEKIFWEEIEAIRRDELPKLYPEPIEPASLEAQILKTITGLRDQVKNGVLPVKTITDTFNQRRSKQEQLTYHRIGRILSAMGFTKTRTGNGAYAIIWDEQVLEQTARKYDKK
jgi:hypothetical protein